MYKKYEEVKIAGDIPFALRPLLTYCRQNHWLQLCPEPEDSLEDQDVMFELMKEFPNKLCLVLQGYETLMAGVFSVDAYMLKVELGGSQQVFDNVLFHKDADCTFCADNADMLVPEIALLSNYVAGKQFYEYISGGLYDYLFETFASRDNDTLAQAIYLALCVQDWSMAIATHGALEDAMPGIRALLPEKLERLGIGFYTARAAIETIAMMILAYHATPQQLKYIFGSLILFSSFM